MGESPHVTRILLIVHPATTSSFHRVLDAEGFQAFALSDISAAPVAVQAHAADLVVLDSRLGESEALQACADIRRESDVPIIMLAEAKPMIYIGDAFERGADDCIRQPIIMTELLIRVKALLRRAGRCPARPRPLGGITLCLEERRVLVHGEDVPLTPLELSVLAALVARPHVVVSRHRLAQLVWGENWAGDCRLVDSHMCRVRGKLTRAGLVPCPIVTVRGIGYVFRPEVAGA